MLSQVVTPHILRHTFATLALQKGISLAKAQTITQEDAAAARLHVLLVEDGISAAMAAKLFLQRCHCTVDIAQDGAKALTQASENTYDLILMDVGLPDMEGTEVARRIRELTDTAKIEPSPDTINTQYIKLKDKNQCLIAISTPPGKSAPYTYDSRPFYRNQSSTMRMPQTRYSQLLLERGMQEHNSWEMQLVSADIDDLDHEEIKRTIYIAVNNNRLNAGALNEPVKDTLIKLELLREDKLTNAAMVLFAKSVLPDFPQCLIKMARFQGISETGEFIDNQMVHGNVFQIMNAANEFIMKHLPVASFFDESKLERIDKPFLPVFAIREALNNSICHRDYSVHNGSITLAIFDDRMEIWNNGKLPSSLTIDDLKKRHKSYPRNKKVARIFYLRCYVETWGTGTTKMIELCESNNVPRPIFEEYSGGFSVTFKFSKTSVKERHEEILRLLKRSESLSAREIHREINLSVAFRTIQMDLLSLKEQGQVRQIGTGKNISWQFIAK